MRLRRCNAHVKPISDQPMFSQLITCSRSALTSSKTSQERVTVKKEEGKNSKAPSQLQQITKSHWQLV